MKNIKYNQYCSIRDSLHDISYKGIGLSQLSAYFIADFVYFFSDKTFSQKIKVLIRSLFFIPRIPLPKVMPNDSVYGWSIERSDYEELSAAYKNSLGWKFENICLGNTYLKKYFNLNFNALFVALKCCIKLKHETSENRIYTFLSVYHSLSLYLSIESRFLNYKPQNYLSFNSSFCNESVFTSYLRNKGVCTYSMQHGMFFEFKNEIPFEMITSYYSAAENVLLWGEFSKNEIYPYHEKSTNLIVFGNPLYFGKSILSSSRYSPNSLIVLVGLPRGLYSNEIKNLLCLISDESLCKYKFIIRCHPSIDKTVLESFLTCENLIFSRAKTIQEDFANEKYRAMIGFNSAVIFEGTQVGIPILQYRSGNDEFYNVGFTEFSDAKNLQKNLKNLEEFSNMNGFYFSPQQSHN